VTADLGPAELVAGCALLALTTYVLLGGADFGGGVWDLLAAGPRKQQQRALIAEAIGPIWEANHVWLILVVVLLFTGFPAAFARLGITLHIPLSLMLIGIVLRGSAFTFRSHYGPATARRAARAAAPASTGAGSSPSRARGRRCCSASAWAPWRRARSPRRGTLASPPPSWRPGSHRSAWASACSPWPSSRSWPRST